MSKIEETLDKLVEMVAKNQDEVISEGLSLSIVVGSSDGNIRSAHIGGVEDYIAFMMHDLASLYDVHLKTATEDEKCNVEEFAIGMAKLFIDAYNDGMFQETPIFDKVIPKKMCGGKPSKFRS